MSHYAGLLVHVLTTISRSGDLKHKFWPGLEASRTKPHGFRQPDRGPGEEGQVKLINRYRQYTTLKIHEAAPQSLISRYFYPFQLQSGRSTSDGISKLPTDCGNDLAPHQGFLLGYSDHASSSLTLSLGSCDSPQLVIRAVTEFAIGVLNMGV